MTGIAKASQPIVPESMVLPVVRHWCGFLAEFGKMLQEEAPLKEQIASPSTIDIEQATAFLQKLSEALDGYRKSGAGINFWEIAGIGSDEVKTCVVLAWLLDCHGSHGLGDAFCCALLGCLRLSANRHSFDAAQLPTAADLYTGYSVKREYCYEELSASEDEEDSGSIYSRVDIQLSGRDFLLFIEAKIYSGENGDQLRRYLSHLNAVANNRKRALVYLTRTGRLPADADLHGSILPLRWRDVADALATCAMQGMPPNSPGLIFIKQFCEYISEY